jgi:MFS family permease
MLLLPANLFSFLTRFAFAVLLVVLPLYLSARLQVSNETVGLIFTFNFIIFSFGQLCAGWLSDRLQVDYDMFIGGLAVGATFLLLPLAPSIQVFAILLAIESFAAAWVTVSLRRLVGRNVAQEDTGKAYGVVGTMGDLGELLGPMIAGFSYAWQAFSPFWVVGFLILLGTLASVLTFNRRPLLSKNG